jgi:hypothetical protein
VAQIAKWFVVPVLVVLPSVRTYRVKGLVTTAIALLFICAAPAMAAGTSLVRLHGNAEGSPVWSGANVLVLLRAGRGFQLRAVDPTSGAASVVARIPRRLGATQLAGSSALIGVEQSNPVCEPGCKYEQWQLEGEELLAGPPGATLQCLAGFGSASCAGLSPCVGVSNVLVSSSRIAYRECDGDSTGQTVVVDYSTTTPTRSVVPQVALPEAISGPWLVGLSPGWETRPALVERNLETGVEPLHIGLSGTGSEYAGESHYPALASVQEDGRIAYVAPKDTAVGPKPESVFTASPSEPHPRATISARVSSQYSGQFIPDQRLFLAGDLLGLEERLPNRRDPPDPLRRLELANLAGQRLGGFEIGEEVSFDFNGSELVALDTPCVESFLVAWGPGQPQPARPLRGVCPTARLVRIALGRQGLAATVRCPASPPVGCLATTVTVDIHIRGRTVSSRGETSDMFPGGRATLGVPLGPRARRWLRRHRTQSVAVQITSGYGETSRLRTRLR